MARELQNVLFFMYFMRSFLSAFIDYYYYLYFIFLLSGPARVPLDPQTLHPWIAYTLPGEEVVFLYPFGTYYNELASCYQPDIFILYDHEGASLRREPWKNVRGVRVLGNDVDWLMPVFRVVSLPLFLRSQRYPPSYDSLSNSNGIGWIDHSKPHSWLLLLISWSRYEIPRSVYVLVKRFSDRMN